MKEIKQHVRDNVDNMKSKYPAAYTQCNQLIESLEERIRNSIYNLDDFEWVKTVDTFSKCKVCGYLRRLSDKSDYSFPDLIYYICLYYYFDREYFTVCHPDMMISNNNMITTAPTYVGEGSVLGNICINNDENNLYVWELEMYNVPESTHTSIGICAWPPLMNLLIFDSVMQDLSWDGANIIDCVYTFKNNGSIRLYVDEPCDYWLSPYGESFKTGDIIKMELDTMNRTLRYYKNDKDLGIAFHDIVFDYYRSPNQPHAVKFAVSRSYCLAITNKCSEQESIHIILRNFQVIAPPVSPPCIKKGRRVYVHYVIAVIVVVIAYIFMYYIDYYNVKFHL
eukprot:511742_1